MRWTSGGVIALLIISLSPSFAASTIKPGSTCKKFGSVVISNNYKFNCIKKYGKLVWDKGSLIQAKTKKNKSTSAPRISTTPIPTPSPTTVSAATPSPSPTTVIAATPSPSPTTVSAATPSPSPTTVTYTPIISLVNKDSNKCTINIDNYNTTYDWQLTTFNAEATMNGSKIEIIPGLNPSSITLVVSKSGLQVGSLDYSCQLT